MPLKGSVSRPRRAISLGLAVLAVAILLVVNETAYRRSRAALDGVVQASRTGGAINQLLLQVVAAETDSRLYLLTGEPRHLEPYQAAVAAIEADLDAWREGSAPEEAQVQATLAELISAVQRKLTDLRLSVQMRRAGNEDGWRSALTSESGKQHMASIREQARKVMAVSEAQMQAGRDQAARALLLARVGTAGVALALLLAIYSYLRQSRALDLAGARQRELLQHERDSLERRVRERTTSLTELATHLQQIREQERGHLARELHDELGALLTAAKLDVARLKSRLGAPPPEISQRLQHLTDTLNSGIALKRRIIEDLRPSSLFNLGLTPSLEILAREFADQTGVQTVLDLGSVEMDEAGQLTVYRVVQESLTNVAKYAEARNVEISLRPDGDQVTVNIRDDGHGFDPAERKPSTHGLAGMRHRVEAAGGTLVVRSSPGQGTDITARLPASAAA